MRTLYAALVYFVVPLVVVALVVVGYWQFGWVGAIAALIVGFLLMWVAKRPIDQWEEADEAREFAAWLREAAARAKDKPYVVADEHRFFVLVALIVGYATLDEGTDLAPWVKDPRGTDTPVDRAAWEQWIVGRRLRFSPLPTITSPFDHPVVEELCRQRAVRQDMAGS